MEGISGLAPALPVSASQHCELWFSTAPGTTNNSVTSPSFPLSSAFSNTSTLIPAACYFKMFFPSSPGCKHVKLEDVSLFPFTLLFNPAGCTPNSQPFSKSPLNTLSGVLLIDPKSSTSVRHRDDTSLLFQAASLQVLCKHQPKPAVSAAPRELYCTGSRHTWITQPPAELQEQGDGPQPPVHMPEPFPSS